MNYVVISPVKDEERYVERTLRSMTCQTLMPLKWIIVDDGSSDRTSKILERYLAQYDFIHVLRRPNRQTRQPGAAVVHAFKLGYEATGEIEYDIVVKLDCDLSFEPDYFQKLIGEFEADSTLGIASGVYLETADGRTWTEVRMPTYHATGAAKAVRRVCFEQIGGFVASRGWDTVDEIRAMARGWRTGHFRELRLKHWKLEGSGIGPIRTNIMHGEVYYLTGGSTLFFIIKLLKRIASAPFLVAGLALLWGYLRALFLRRDRLVTNEEARSYQALLNSRIKRKLKELFCFAH